ncbi:GntR family transcriptional regulator [Streptomyces chryseus]|uniref:GntR family transcriptional regulator n=1 Tax=Streptomyces chryseus TaxID=68186 RepID=UPI003F6DDEC6
MTVPDLRPYVDPRPLRELGPLAKEAGPPLFRALARLFRAAGRLLRAIGRMIAWYAGGVGVILALLTGWLSGKYGKRGSLGARFGVSATPVREAMQQLVLEGAVEVVPNRGFRVTVRSATELAELAEVRSLIEVPVMLRLARTVPAARWCELRPLAEATTTAAATGNRAAYAESDRAFHRAVLSLAGNHQLVAVADDLHRRSQWPLLTGDRLGRRADLLADAAEHLALLDALAARDLTVVQSLVSEHFAGADR